MIPKYIKKRDGKTTRFEGYKIKGAILKAATSIQIENPDTAVEKIYLKTIEKLDENKLMEVLKGLTSNISKFSSYKDITSFEDACEYLGIDSEDVYDESADTKDEIAYKRLKVIYKAINKLNNWVVDYKNSNQYKYYPWFNVVSGFSYSDCICDITFAYVGVRLCCGSREEAEYIGTTFTTEYKDYLL